MGQGLGSFMGNMAHNLGDQLGGGGMSGLGQVGGPMSGIGILKKLMGGGGHDDQEETPKTNPGQQMMDGVGASGVDPQGGNSAGGNKDGYLKRFGGNLSDQLFQRAMMGFMGR